MNANELADNLEGAKLVILRLNEMLRQQQAEIEALKAGKIRAYDNGVEDGRKPNTHPVKELTDEEIEQVRVAIMCAAYWCADENMTEAYNAVKLCCGQVLGILDKAQEK